jgi:hypothetical protein
MREKKGKFIHEENKVKLSSPVNFYYDSMTEVLLLFQSAIKLQRKKKFSFFATHKIENNMSRAAKSFVPIKINL